MEQKLRFAIIVGAVVVVTLAVPIGLGLSAAFGAGSEEPAAAKAGAVAEQPAPQRAPIEVLGFAIAVAATTSLGCMSAGYAVGKVGAAALGAVSERPELLGRTLIFVGLAEGIAIYGLIVAIMLMSYLR